MHLSRIPAVAGTYMRSPNFGSIVFKQSCPVNNSLSYTIVRCKHRKSIYKREEAKKLRFYVVTKYVEYLKNFDKVLAKNFPETVQTYRLFIDGTKEFIKDTKEYFRIIRILNTPGKSFANLLRREMELYQQMPKDMKKVAPVLIIFSIPFGSYVILPLAYMFPRYLLCSHFWNLKQKSEYQILSLKDRLTHNRPIFRHLQSQMYFLKPHCLYKSWKEVVGKIGSGVHPTVGEIAKCKELFMTEPYHLLYLSSNHIVHLLKMHDMSVGIFFRRSRLTERAYILKEMDKAIMREGGVHNLPIDALKKACYIRGLNPTNMKNEEMIKWLTDWIQLSSQVDKDSYSLLLHAPVLLSYNAPSNWMLIYKEKYD
ncbi:LETM1 domain-containing protein 1 isoform X2 [Diabrotica undecimpunctata]|uniref:LETM1 domain-containing protein 1 isoform X2 n=1 Tax=Diabrotica undecimpunctata TaxID=50387 RepID=UPI003B642706